VGCDYFLFTNGDNLYNNRMLHAVLPHMVQGAPLIGMEFTSHYDWQAGDVEEVVRVPKPAPPSVFDSVSSDADATATAATSAASSAPRPGQLVRRRHVMHAGRDVQVSFRWMKGWCDKGAVLIRHDLVAAHDFMPLDVLRASPSGNGIDFAASDGDMIMRAYAAAMQEVSQGTGIKPVVVRRALMYHQ
jgi:hypothetical protein